MGRRPQHGGHQRPSGPSRQHSVCRPLPDAAWLLACPCAAVYGPESVFTEWLVVQKSLARLRSVVGVLSTHLLLISIAAAFLVVTTVRRNDVRTVVLVKQVPDTEEPRRLQPETGWIDRSDHPVLDEITSRALAWALEVRKAEGGEVIALTMGPATATEVLREALAIGADESVHVQDDDLAGADAVLTSAVLAAVLREIGCDLVVAGATSTDGEIGAVPAMVAERLGLPHLTYLGHAQIADGRVTGTREAGQTLAEVAANLPAVLSVTETIADPRVPGFKGILTAKRKPRRTLGLADLTLEAPQNPWEVEDVTATPARGRGEVIADAGDGADRIIAFLSTHQLLGK